MWLGCRSIRAGLGAWMLTALWGQVVAADVTAVEGATAEVVNLHDDWFVAAAARDAARQSPTFDLQTVSLRGNNGKLLGLIRPSDQAFWNFVSPQSNPLFFEDPRNLTELRFHFAQHWIPTNNPVFQGGDAQFLAAQARFALTERLSLIATKDGYIWLNPANAAVPGRDGFADVGGGLKYNFFRDPCMQTLASAGFTYWLPCGAERVFQGNGNGEWHLFLTGGKEFFGCCHWVSGAGLRLPNDGGANSKMSYWSNSFDVQLTRRVYAMTQLNWFHWLDSGGNLAADFEGGDLFNLGSTDVAGNDIVTASWGGRFKFGKYHETGVAYEVPLTERRDLLQSRLYVDLTLRF